MAETSTSTTTTTTTKVGNAEIILPRVTIKYCTQCRWMLRAAYFAQELLSTFSTQIGEIALQPATGGIFTVTVIHSASDQTSETTPVETQETLLWDRKTEGGFPETKQLKSLLRNIIDPSRNLGHSEYRSSNKDKDNKEQEKSSITATPSTAPPTASEQPSKQNKAAAAEAVGAAPQEAATVTHSHEEGKQVCEDCQ